MMVSLQPNKLIAKNSRSLTDRPTKKKEKRKNTSHFQGFFKHHGLLWQ
jgi:hypothetical protein